jgi:hypothetical protein
MKSYSNLLKTNLSGHGKVLHFLGESCDYIQSKLFDHVPMLQCSLENPV